MNSNKKTPEEALQEAIKYSVPETKDKLKEYVRRSSALFRDEPKRPVYGDIAKTTHDRLDEFIDLLGYNKTFILDCALRKFLKDAGFDPDEHIELKVVLDPSDYKIARERAEYRDRTVEEAIKYSAERQKKRDEKHEQETT